MRWEYPFHLNRETRTAFPSGTIRNMMIRKNAGMLSASSFMRFFLCLISFRLPFGPSSSIR